MKSYAGLALAYLCLMLTKSKGQGQGRAYFDDDYLRKCERYGTNYNRRQIESNLWAFDRHIYIRP